MTPPRCAPTFVALWLVPRSCRTAPVQHQHLYRHEASRISMACEYAIEAYGPDADALPRIVDEAFDEVDRIDRLMSHYKATSPLSRINREAAQHPVAVEPELFDFIADAMRYHRDSGGAFDITVGPLMKAWGFFQGEGRVPSEDELAAATPSRRRRPCDAGSDFEDDPLRSARRGAGSRRHRQGLRRRSRRRIAQTAADRGRPDQRRRQHDLRARCAARRRRHGRSRSRIRSIPEKPRSPFELKDRALSVAGSSEKSFEAGGAHVFTHHGPARRQAGAGGAERGGAHEHRNGRRCARQRVLRARPGRQPSLFESSFRTRKRFSSCPPPRAAAGRWSTGAQRRD